MWKASLRFGEQEVPVKLYAGVQERGLHFRLLHAKDRVPVKQRMVDAKTGEEVPSDQIRRGMEVEKDVYVLLGPEDLEGHDPNPEKVIEIMHFVPRSAVDLAWYARPYYLDPDDSAADFFALAAALESSERVGLARWTMRRTPYVGALAAKEGYLELITLHSFEEVVPLASFEKPEGPDLSAGERKLAEQLVSTLDAPFDPSVLRDEYRERVVAMIEQKARGKKFVVKEAPRPRVVGDLSLALQRSIKAAREKKVA